VASAESGGGAAHAFGGPPSKPTGTTQC
jgi:hypothetical protein